MDISFNKLETLANFEHLKRIKRLIAKQNFVRELSYLKDCSNIYELDLEENAIDSHKDFLGFIKGKTDLIIVNLHQNPLMVDIASIEQFNSILI